MQNVNSRQVDHLLELARKGSDPAASGAEQQARQIVECLLENAVGLDMSATRGIRHVVDVIQANPMSGREAIRDVIG